MPSSYFLILLMPPIRVQLLTVCTSLEWGGTTGSRILVCYCALPLCTYMRLRIASLRDRSKTQRPDVYPKILSMWYNSKRQGRSDFWARPVYALWKWVAWTRVHIPTPNTLHIVCVLCRIRNTLLRPSTLHEHCPSFSSLLDPRIQVTFEWSGKSRRAL